MTQTVVAATQITLVDLNDAFISGTQPSNPVVNQLWIDTSQNPNILKQWNGSAWVVQTLALSSLDNTQYTNLQNNITAVNNMSSDSVITQSERITVKSQIQEMIGSVPTDTYTLPAIATVDGSGLGQLYQVRKSALNAGISTTDTNYSNLETQYTTLANYLNGLNPLPWNVTSTAALTIVAATWRANWNNYYNALYQLQQYTTMAMKNYIASRGQNLVTNGTGLLGNNTNFSAFTFNGADGYSTKGSFTDSTYSSTRYSDEIMPVDVSKTYRLNIWAKANPYVSGAHCYLGISEFDSDGLQITSQNHMYIANTLTTLATALNPGDTVINLTSATNWQNAAGAASQNRSIIFWNYTNASGYTWPAQTYSRNYSSSDLWADGSVNFSTNKITLRTGWTGSSFPAGTQVSNGSAGGTYKYIAAGNVNIPNTWTNYTGTIGGTDNTGNNVASQFSWGTAGVKLLFLNNRDVTGNTSWFSNLSFTVDLASQSSVDTINTTLNAMASDSSITQSERITIKDMIQQLLGSVPADASALPTMATIDASLVGELYQTRKAALNAGILTSDTNYSNVESKYTILANYLNGMIPYPWDVTSTSIITITASAWRANWNNFYNALYQLQQYTTATLQGSINSVSGTLGNMANDATITQSERITIKSDVTDIIGFVPFDNNFGVTNFVNKTSGSTTANPNISYYSGVAAIQSPAGTWTEDAQSYYTNIATQNSTVFTISTGAASTGTAQALYKFDLINYIKSTYGYTPTVAWLEQNVKQIKFSWFGYGTGVNGNKAYIDAWNTTTNVKWGSPLSTTSGSIASLLWDSTVNQTNIQNLIDPNGFVYFYSYSDAVAAVSVPTALVAGNISQPVNAGNTQATGTIYVTYTWVTANGETTAPTSLAVSYTTGHNIAVTLPTFPAGVTQAKVYMGTVSGSETYQGNTVTTTYTQSTVLASGTAKPASNTAYVSSINNTDYAELQVTLWPIPTTTGLDVMGVGSYATIRKAAINAGILATDSNYTNLAAQYNTLSSYLEGLTPVFPWSVTTSDVINVTPSTWRNNWNNYYLAEQQLQQYTVQTLQGNVNGVQPSGRNLLMNTALLTDATNPYWALSIGSAITGSLNVPYNDPVYGGVLWATMSTNSATGNNWYVIENSSLTLPNKKFTIGQQYTISFMIKNAFPVYVNISDSNSSNAVTTDWQIPVNANWTFYSNTFTATATGNTSLLCIGASDDTSTGDLFLTQVKLETGNRATGWSAAPEEIGNTLASLQTRATKLEQATTADSISSTVVNSNQMASLMQGKANASDLANYATQAQLTQASANANSYTDGKVGAINFTPYAKVSYVDQTATAITDQFATFGGINILKNSVGFALDSNGKPTFWTIDATYNNVTTSQSTELYPYGSESGFVLNGGKISQIVTVQPNMEFTVSVYVKKGSTGTGYLQVTDGTQTIAYNLASGTTYQYQQVQVQISPVGNTFTVTLFGDATSGGIVFTSLMANIGSNALQWTNNPQEIYNTNIQHDLNGIRVSQTSNGVVTGVTVMTPTKFAGYTDQNNDGIIDQTTGSVDEIFRMDQNAFVMKSAIIKPVQMVPVINQNGHNGIAFVSST